MTNPSEPARDVIAEELAAWSASENVWWFWDQAAHHILAGLDQAGFDVVKRETDAVPLPSPKRGDDLKSGGASASARVRRSATIQ